MKKQLRILLLLLPALLLFAARQGYACGKMKASKTVAACCEHKSPQHHPDCNDHGCDCLAGCHTGVKGAIPAYTFLPVFRQPRLIRWYYAEHVPAKVFLPTFVPPKIGRNTAV